MATIAAMVAIVVLGPARAQERPGVTATEIKIGNTMPYSGSASDYAIIGKAEAAYFTMVNDRGGIAGHKITFVSLMTA
jgi:branched-chain amino acid transport system substrate-binding protein